MALLSHRPVHVLAVAALAFATTLPGSAQSRATVTADDYLRAEKFLGYNTNPLVSNGAVQRDVAARATASGIATRAPPAPNSSWSMRRRPPRAPAFDHAAVAAALTTAMGKPVTAARLPFSQITFAADVAVVLVRQ